MMKFIDVINSPQLAGYFRRRSDKWIAEFSALINKGGVSDLEVGDKQSQAKQLKIIKFSWLGLFLNYLWGAYHNSYLWLPIAIIFSTANAVDLLFFDGEFGSALSVVPGVIYAMYGKSYLLAAKARELNDTGGLAPPSWLRVAIAVGIFMIPLLFYFLLVDLTGVES